MLKSNYKQKFIDTCKHLYCVNLLKFIKRDYFELILKLLFVASWQGHKKEPNKRRKNGQLLVKVFIWFPMISRKSKLLAYEVFFYVVFDFSIKAKIREYKNPSCVSIQDRDVLPKGRNFNQTMLA